jgi:hypothetical protein
MTKIEAFLASKCCQRQKKDENILGFQKKSNFVSKNAQLIRMMILQRTLNPVTIRLHLDGATTFTITTFI